MNEPDKNAAERLEKLLDVALAGLKADDGAMTVMALDEAVKTAEGLPKKAEPPSVIYLPDET